KRDVRALVISLVEREHFERPAQQSAIASEALCERCCSIRSDRQTFGLKDFASEAFDVAGRLPAAGNGRAICPPLEQLTQAREELKFPGLDEEEIARRGRLGQYLFEKGGVTVRCISQPDELAPAKRRQSEELVVKPGGLVFQRL